MMVQAKCPQCGATMQVDDTRNKLFCTYCGAEIVNMAQRVEVQQTVNVSGEVRHTMDKYPDVQAVVRYRANRSDLPLIVRFDRTPIVHVLNGDERTFRLAPGLHAVVLKVGNHNYNRQIYVSERHEVVFIEVDWFGRAQIHIQQPQSAQAPAQVSVTSKGPSKALLIWGIIVAALGLICLLGVIGSGDVSVLLVGLVLLLGGGGMILGHILKNKKKP